MNHNSSSNNKISFQTKAIMKEIPTPSPPTSTAPPLLQAGLFLVINAWRLPSEKEIITPLTSLPTPAVILAAACCPKLPPERFSLLGNLAGSQEESRPTVCEVWLVNRPPSPSPASPGSTIVEEQLFSFTCAAASAGV